MASWEDINLDDIKTGFITRGLTDPPGGGGRQSMVTVLNTFLDAIEEKLYAVSPLYEPDDSYRFEYGTIMNGNAESGDKTFLSKIEYLAQRYYSAWRIGWYTEEALGIYENHEDFRLYDTDLEEAISEEFVQVLTGGPANKPSYNMANIWRADFFQGLYVLYGMMRYTKAKGVDWRRTGPESSGYFIFNREDQGYSTRQQSAIERYDWEGHDTCVSVDAESTLNIAFDACMDTLENTNNTWIIHAQTFTGNGGVNDFYRKVSTNAKFYYRNKTGFDFVFRKWEDKKCVSNIVHSPLKCEVYKSQYITRDKPAGQDQGNEEAFLFDSALPEKGGHFQHTELNTEVISDPDKGESLFISYGSHPPSVPQLRQTYGNVCPDQSEQGVNSFGNYAVFELRIHDDGLNIIFDSNFSELNFYIEPS